MIDALECVLRMEREVLEEERKGEGSLGAWEKGLEVMKRKRRRVVKTK